MYIKKYIFRTHLADNKPRNSKKSIYSMNLSERMTISHDSDSLQLQTTLKIICHSTKINIICVQKIFTVKSNVGIPGVLQFQQTSLRFHLYFSWLQCANVTSLTKPFLLQLPDDTNILLSQDLYQSYFTGKCA